MAEVAKCKCKVCGRMLRETEFYTYKDGRKMDTDKKCLTMHIKNDDPSTFLWILEELDIAWIPSFWKAEYAKAYAKYGDKMTGISVLGKYLSKMRIKQYSKYTYKDSEKAQMEIEGSISGNLEDLEEAKKIQEEMDGMLREQFENGEISEAQYRTLSSTAFQEQQDFQDALKQDMIGFDNNFHEENYLSEDELAIGDDLSREEKIAMAVKWGRLYQPADWIAMETNYRAFHDAFQIQDPARDDTLKKICKTSLKMDQAIDIGDVDGYNKLARTYDTLMKAGKFTEAQRKEEKNSGLDSAGMIVRFAESRKGGGKIARHKVDKPFDIYDEMINILKDYYTSLFMSDPTIKQQVEAYIKKRENAELTEQMKQDAKKIGADEYQVTNEDLIQYKEEVEAQREIDKETTAQSLAEVEDKNYDD